MTTSSSCADLFSASLRTAVFALLGVIGWFLFTEIATQVWYRWQETQRPLTHPWPIQWPTKEDAEARGFLNFQPREMGDAEKELLRFKTGQAASWRSNDGAQWTGFYIQWDPNRDLNQMDLTHNPTVCLAGAGLVLVRSIPATEEFVGDFRAHVNAWEFEYEGQQVYVYVMTRWGRDFNLFAYKQGSWQMRLGNIWRALVGNRGNPLQTIELVGVGFDSEFQAHKAFENQLLKLSGT